MNEVPSFIQQGLLNIYDVQGTFNALEIQKQVKETKSLFPWNVRSSWKTQIISIKRRYLLSQMVMRAMQVQRRESDKVGRRGILGGVKGKSSLLWFYLSRDLADVKKQAVHISGKSIL